MHAKSHQSGPTLCDPMDRGTDKEDVVYISTPVFLTRESHGQRYLVGYSPWGHKESDMTDITACMHACTHLTKIIQLD